MITDLLSPTLLGSLVLYATPILLAGVGAMFTQRANILNIALEGMMLTAAFFAIAVGAATQSWPLAVLAAILAALVMSLLFAYVSLVLKADFIVAGIGINLLASGLTVFLLERLYHNSGSYSPFPFPEIARLDLPRELQDVPVVGPIIYGAFNSQSIIVFLALLLVVVSHIVLYRTKLGLHIRATGENAGAVEAAGLNPTRLKIVAVLISGLCAGLAGAQLSMATLNQFVREMTGGVGFIGLAAMIFGNATPLGTLIASLVFGLAGSVADRVQTLSSVHIPPQLVLMLPYIVTLTALTLALIRRRRGHYAV